MTWRMARSLDTLLGQLNARFPNRNKASDGGIGDAAHATRDSDHNPWYVLNGTPLVTARDFTHDPRVMNGGWLADTLIAHNDPRIKYIIWNRRIWTPGVGWRAYTGSNPHDHHLHLSVDANPSADSTTPWAGINQPAPVPPKEKDMDLTDSLAAHTWDKRTVAGAENVGNALMNIYNRVAGLSTAMATVVAEVTNDPELTADAVKALMDQAVRDNLPAAAPVDLESIKQAVREAAGEDNAELADRIADNLVTRLAN